MTNHTTTKWSTAATDPIERLCVWLVFVVQLGKCPDSTEKFYYQLSIQAFKFITFALHKHHTMAANKFSNYFSRGKFT